ncbi:Arc family DNA-binding protein [Pleomorphomonas sp. PLEO]|uniref:Arc family DNA-binding protein n=1 Tax=Pleomorphomonas sp. PLEO TaxID=3239306 RepID=UPI00351F0FCC
MARDDPQLKIRLPIEMKEAIEEAATRNGRSINAEIISRLMITLEKGDPYEKLDGFQEEILGKISKYNEIIDEQFEVRKKLEDTIDAMTEKMGYLTKVANSETMKEIIDFIAKKENIEPNNDEEK